MIIEVGVIDSVNINISVGSEKGFSEEGVMSLSVSSVDGVEVFQLVARFRYSHHLFCSVDSRVHDMEPRESEDNVFSATAHNIEEMFLNNPFDVHVESASVTDCSSFVHSLVNISDHDGGGKFLGWELVLSDKLSVNAGDISTRIY